jgi:hypothetical protein
MGKANKRNPKTGQRRKRCGRLPNKVVIVPSEHFDKKRFQEAMRMLISKGDIIRYFREQELQGTDKS